ncbi:MAG: hypothetical protein WD183_02070 [Nitrosopumilaceae archaeon]
MNFKRRIQKLEQIFNSDLESKLVDLNIPKDPQEFYQDLGLLKHPKTNQPVIQLTPYQYSIWNNGYKFKYRLTIKSQKVGITTSSLMEDFQKAVTTCRGKEILVIAQNLQLARDHLYTLRKMIKGSKKYSQFLIDKPTNLLFRDEVSKITVIFIRNPDNLNKPTRIIGLGPREGSVWSWKEVAHIHMSDVAASDQLDDSGLFGAVFSRLANTDGTLHIETPPRGQRGKIWEIYQNNEAQFKVTEVPATEAVKGGLITQEFLDAEKQRLGTLYGQYYECAFLNPFNTWYDDSLFSFEEDSEDVL